MADYVSQLEETKEVHAKKSKKNMNEYARLVGRRDPNAAPKKPTGDTAVKSHKNPDLQGVHPKLTAPVSWDELEKKAGKHRAHQKYQVHKKKVDAIAANIKDYQEWKKGKK